MRVVFKPTTVARKTVNIMTKRRKRHSPEQIVRKIQGAEQTLAEGGDVVAVLTELNLTEAAHSRWRDHLGSLKAKDARKLKHLEKQDLALKKLLAEAELEKAVLRELTEGNFYGQAGDAIIKFMGPGGSGKSTLIARVMRVLEAELCHN